MSHTRRYEFTWVPQRFLRHGKCVHLWGCCPTSENVSILWGQRALLQVKAMLVEAHWRSWNGWRLDAGRAAKLENLRGSINVIQLGENEGGEHFPPAFSTLLVTCTSFALGNEINENKDDRILSLKKRALLSLSPFAKFFIKCLMTVCLTPWQAFRKLMGKKWVRN